MLKNQIILVFASLFIFACSPTHRTLESCLEKQVSSDFDPTVSKFQTYLIEKGVLKEWSYVEVYRLVKSLKDDEKRYEMHDLMQDSYLERVSLSDFLVLESCCKQDKLPDDSICKILRTSFKKGKPNDSLLKLLESIGERRFNKEPTLNKFFFVYLEYYLGLPENKRNR